jgi:hypothetical protein
MKVIECLIPTNKRMWSVTIRYWARRNSQPVPEVGFYVGEKHRRLFSRVPENAIPLSVRRRARSFLASPEIFGRTRYI